MLTPESGSWLDPEMPRKRRGDAMGLGQRQSPFDVKLGSNGELLAETSAGQEVDVLSIHNKHCTRVM
jgi:hypothetical protein